MDDSRTRMKANMEKVLRAMDIVPPFGPEGKPRREAGERPQRAPSEASEPHPQQTEEQDQSSTPIPEFDLGERILAEQRRISAGRRKAPGTPETARGRTVDVPTRTEGPFAVPNAADLTRLQRVVAEIVARDIESLCTGPARTRQALGPTSY